jgi:hypothetical protein
MANDANGNPIFIDTVGVVTTSPVRLVTAVFIPSDVAHIVTLTDNSGRTILTLKGHASAAEEQIIVPLEDTRVMGITCTVCTAGASIYLYTNATCS